MKTQTVEKYNNMLKEMGIDYYYFQAEPFKIIRDEQKQDEYFLNKGNLKYNTNFKKISQLREYEREVIAPKLAAEYWTQLYNEKHAIKENNSYTLEWYVNHYLKNQTRTNNFIYNDSNNSLIDFLIGYFKQATKQMIGILIFGNAGSGKTTIMKAFQISVSQYYNRKFYYVYCDSLDLIRRFKKDPEDLTMFLHNKHLYIDDLGLEPKTVANYGDNTDVMAEVILERYNRWHNNNELTFFTTNLNLNELKERYGDRVFSRLMEMTTQKSLLSNSFRTLNLK